MRIMLLGLGLLLGCVDRPLDVPIGAQLVTVDAAAVPDMRPACPVEPNDPTIIPPANACEVRGGCCRSKVDCAPLTREWFCVDGWCCMPAEAWRREFPDAGGP